MTEQDLLLGRIREVLIDELTLREKPMFGTRSLFVRDKLLVSVGKDGGVLVRVPPDRHDELLGFLGAEPARMGRERLMGPGWIHVCAAGIDSDDGLAFWIGVAMEYNRAIADPPHGH